MDKTGNSPHLLLVSDNPHKDFVRDTLAATKAAERGEDYESLRTKLFEKNKLQAHLKFGSPVAAQSFKDDQCIKQEYGSLNWLQDKHESKRIHKVADNVTIVVDRKPMPNRHD